MELCATAPPVVIRKIDVLKTDFFLDQAVDFEKAYVKHHRCNECKCSVFV